MNQNKSRPQQWQTIASGRLYLPQYGHLCHPFSCFALSLSLMIQLWIKAISQNTILYTSQGIKSRPLRAALIDGIKAKNPLIVQIAAPPVLFGHMRKAGPAINTTAISAFLFMFMAVNSFILIMDKIFNYLNLVT